MLYGCTHMSTVRVKGLSTMVTAIVSNVISKRSSHSYITIPLNCNGKTDNVLPQSMNGVDHTSRLQAECSSVVQSTDITLVKCSVDVHASLSFVHLTSHIFHGVPVRTITSLTSRLCTHLNKHLLMDCKAFSIYLSLHVLLQIMLTSDDASTHPLRE